MLRTALCLFYFFTVTSMLLAQNKDVDRIITRYKAIRPRAKDLTIYQLDWADSLEEALQRAASESRPIFLIIIQAKYGDISSGHC